jgi:hypothetical protein
MKTLLLIPAAFLLTGCLFTTVPVKRTFPEVPKEIMEACPDLKAVPDTEKLSEVLKVVTENYSQYQECKIKVDTWVEWYKTQKIIFDSVK